MSSRDEAVNDASSLPNGGPISSSSSSSSEQELRDTYKLVLKFFRGKEVKVVFFLLSAAVHIHLRGADTDSVGCYFVPSFLARCLGI